MKHEEVQASFPTGPAWAVGADREHQGPSGMGPGEDCRDCDEDADPDAPAELATIGAGSATADDFFRSEPPAD